MIAKKKKTRCEEGAMFGYNVKLLLIGAVCLLTHTSPFITSPPVMGFEGKINEL
jgi:hypothetical protein